MSTPEASTTLYITPADWQLPSKSIACIQLETYMRMARLPFTITSCTTANASPSGYLPAVEIGSTLITPALPPGTWSHTAPTTELLVAADLIRKLERGPTMQGPSTDAPSAPSALDGVLSAAHRAQADAFAALLTARLQPATLYATWVASHGFRKYTRVAYGRDLPLPLSYIVPWGIRRAVLQEPCFRGGDGQAVADAVYGDAAMAYAAIAAQLDAVQGDYLFGEEPSSTDALLYGYLLYHLVAPVMPPELQDKLTSYPVLVRYVERITTSYYASPTPQRPESVLQAWAEYSREQQEEQTGSGAAAGMSIDPRRRTTNWLWLGAAAALMLGFWSQQPHFPIMFMTYGDDEVGEEELEELEDEEG